MGDVALLAVPPAVSYLAGLAVVLSIAGALGRRRSAVRAAGTEA